MQVFPMIRVLIFLTLGIFSSQVMSSNVVSFDCTPGVFGDGERHTVDLDNKTWEWDDYVFKDVTVSANNISVEGTYKMTTRRFVTIEISRIDLTYSFTRESSFAGIPQKDTKRGQCSIVENKVERAF